MQIIQRVRRMGIISHIRVDLGLAAFVESAALAGLRNDLNAIDGGASGSEVAGMPAPGGVSLELTAHRDDSAALPTPGHGRGIHGLDRSLRHPER